MAQELQDILNERNVEIETLNAQSNSGTLNPKETKRITKEIAKLE
ncbi:BREX-1 system adenine-specific DNA-methyltransferase PglX [Sporosarcina sp. D27]|nr:BREX-1 system adenine-specific DNA-methyltransferase PglX [Sporosarcina sp. D27]